MNEKIKKVTTVVKDKWTGFSNVVKALIIAIPVAAIVAIIVVAVVLNHKDTTVLFSGLSTSEQGEIASAITELGVSDVTVNANGDIIVPEDQADYLRMQLAVEGYPKSGDNYDIWNDGVDLWSTDSDKREVQRQQRETRIANTLTTLDSIKAATVNLDLGTSSDYVLVSNSSDPTCSITLRLKDGSELTNAEVRAIYSMVTASVDGLINDNVSVIDTQGREYQWISEEEEQSGERDASGTLVAAKRLAFQNEYRAAIMEELKDFFDLPFGEGNYSVNVSATLNYDAMTQEEVEYYPSGDDNTGVLDHSKDITEASALDSDEGLVGVTPNADESPDYPTYTGLEDGQSYYYNLDENQYDVSYIKTNLEKDGYSIENLSVALMINTNSLTETEREAYADLVAKAAGTTVDNVSVFNTVFALGNGGGTTAGDNSTSISIRQPDSYRDMLLYIVVILGILLIVLLIVSLFMSKSRKRKIKHRQEQALAAAASGNAQFGSSSQEPEQPEEVDFNIASLTEEAGKDSKETILKREIAEFSKSSPEIVAQIIRNMLREDS